MVNIAKGLKPKNNSQAKFLHSIRENTITLGIGEAGTGKTLLAMYAAILAINNPESPIDSILYVRPFVNEPDEQDIGALPGEYEEKIDFLGLPLWTNLCEICSPDELRKFKTRLEISHIGKLKGASLSNTFIIFDEAEDATQRLFNCVITRISHGSKLVIIGDRSQSSLRCGGFFQTAAHRLFNTQDVGVVWFPKGSCVRHPIIPHVLTALAA